MKYLLLMFVTGCMLLAGPAQVLREDYGNNEPRDVYCQPLNEDLYRCRMYSSYERPFLCEFTHGRWSCWPEI